MRIVMYSMTEKEEYSATLETVTYIHKTENIDLINDSGFYQCVNNDAYTDAMTSPYRASTSLRLIFIVGVRSPFSMVKGSAMSAKRRARS